MTVKVGSAYSEMLLKYDQFLRGADLVEQRLKRLHAEAAKPIVVPTLGPGGSGNPSNPGNLPAVRNTADAELRLTQQRARLVQVTQGNAAAEQLLTRAKQLGAGASERARLGLDLQIARLQKGTTLAQEFGQSFSGSLNSMIGPAALATAGVTALFGAVSAGIAAGGEALALREQRNSLKAVAGSVNLYAEALSTARQQQLLFGGSIRENIDGIQGLTIVSRESGASLQQLVGLTQRLNLKSPEQGIGGARIAITEALSGNTRSLARRFEIPNDKLKDLGDTSLPVAQRLAAIDTYLAGIGITAEAVAGKVDKDALAFRRLSAELEQVSLNAGDNLASAFGGAATGLARLLGLINQNPKAIAEMRALFSGRGTIDTTDIDRATRDVASSRAAEVTGGQRGGSFVAERLGGTEELVTLRQRLVDLQIQNEETGRSALALTEAWVREGGATSALYAQLDVLARQGLPAALDAHDRMAASSRTVTNALGEQTLETLETAAAAEKQRRVMASIALQSDLVRKGMITQAQGAAVLRGQLGAAADEALRLQLELGRAASIQSQKDAPLSSAEKSFIDRANAGQAGKGDASARLTKEKELRDAQKQYQRDLLQFAPLADQIRAKQRELATIGADDPKRFAVQLDIRRLQEQLENERLRTSKSQTSEYDKQLKLNESIYDSQQKQYQAALDARLLANEDARQDILDQDKLRQARNALANAKDPRFRALAALEIERIGLEDQKRAADLAGKGATAGAPIVDGRLLQSLSGVGAPTAAPAPGGAPGGAPGFAPTGAPGGVAGLTIVNQFYVDGRLIAEEIEPVILANARAGVAQLRAGGGGGAP